MLPYTSNDKRPTCAEAVPASPLDLVHDAKPTLLMSEGFNMDNTIIPANAHRQRCPRCQSPMHTVVVHGHEQCVTCKSNIFECCSGDTCQTDHNLSVGYRRG